MAEHEITCWHIYHSGTAFFSPINNNLHIFDFSRQKDSKFPGSWLNNYQITSTFIYVTHGHSDHFNQEIFSWGNKLPETTYILSTDVKNKTKKNAKQSKSFNFMQPGDNLKLSNIEIRAYGSTDEGVSFLVKNSHFSTFHSGDLNWWAWKSFSEKERKREAREYKQIINKLKDKNIDLAFVPVDPRLEENYYLAGKYFLENIEPKIMIPIHMGSDYSAAAKFIENHGKRSTHIPEINEPGQKFKFSL